MGPAGLKAFTLFPSPGISLPSASPLIIRSLSFLRFVQSPSSCRPLMHRLSRTQAVAHVTQIGFVIGLNGIMTAALLQQHQGSRPRLKANMRPKISTDFPGPSLASHLCVSLVLQSTTLKSCRKMKLKSQYNVIVVLLFTNIVVLAPGPAPVVPVVFCLWPSPFAAARDDVHSIYLQFFNNLTVKKQTKTETKQNVEKGKSQK